jgi:hypothetical protein
MRSKTPDRLLVLGILSAAALLAQDAPLPGGSVSFPLPNDSPVASLGFSTGESRATARGAAMVLDLHLSVPLRNISNKRIRGITLRVVSQDVTLGGQASVSMTSLNVGPGEVVPVRIDRPLIRPTQVAGGPLVEIYLDGVLFQDLSFYGPDRLNSRRTMTAWEMEAQRDRDYFKRVLAASGREGLKREMVDSLARQAAPQLEVRLLRAPAVTSTAIAQSEHTEKFAFLTMPDSPVEPTEGFAMVSGNEVRAPRIQVRNRSGKPVKHVELGWLVRDAGGQQYMAASLPSSDPDLFLPAGKTAKVEQDTTLRFSHAGKPVNIQSMSGFVSQVEFADGKVWVPNRQSLASDLLRNVLPPSAEEQRLTDLYRRKGPDALIEELKKY